MPRRLILSGLFLFAAAQPECPPPSTSIPADVLGSANFSFAPAITALYLCASASCSAGCSQLNSAPILLDGRCAPLGDSTSVRATGGGGAPGGGTASLTIFSGLLCADPAVFSSPSLALAGNPSTGCVPTGASGTGSGIFASGSTSPSPASVRVTQNAVELVSPDGRLSAGGASNAAQHKRYCVRSVVSVPPVNPGGSAWALLVAGLATLTVPVEDARCAAARNHSSLWLRAEKFTPNTGGAAGNAGCARGPCMALNISALVTSMAPPDPAAPPAAAATAPLLPVPSLSWAASASQAAFRCPPPTPLAGPSGPPGPLRDGQGPVAGATRAGGAPAPLPPLLSFPPVPAGWAGGVVVALSGGWLGALKGLDYDAGPAGALLAMEGDCIRSYAAAPERGVFALSLGGAGGGGTNAKCGAVDYGAAGAAVGVVSLPPGVAGAPPAPCGTPPTLPPGSVGVAVRDFLRPWSASPSPPPPPPPAPSPAPWAAVDEHACPRLPAASELLARDLFGFSVSATFPADLPPCPAPPGPCPPPPPPEPAVLSFAPATGVTWYSPSRKAAVALCPSSVARWSQDAAYYVVEAPFSAIPVPMPWAPTCPVVVRRCILARLEGGTLFAVMNETMRACDAFFPANYTLNAAGPGWAPPGSPPAATACEATAMPELLRGHGWAANTTLPPRTFYDPTGRPVQLVLSAWGAALVSPRGLNGSEVWRQCASAALDVGGGGLGPWALTLSAPPVGPSPPPPGGGGGRCYLFARSGDDLTITEGPPAPEGGAACGAPAGWATAYAPFTYAGFYAAAAGGGALRAWPSQSPSPSATPPVSASPSATPTATISVGATASNTGSSSGSGTGTGAASGTASNSLSPTAALSPGASPSATPTCTGTLSTGASPSNSAAGAAGAATANNAREVENAVGGTFGFLFVAGALALGALAWRRSAARRGRAIAKGVSGGGPGAAVVQMNPLGAGAAFAPAAHPPPPSLNAAPPAPRQLPPGWIEQTDGVDVWFVDTATGESHWEVPQPPPAAAVGLRAGGAAV